MLVASADGTWRCAGQVPHAMDGNTKCIHGQERGRGGGDDRNGPVICDPFCRLSNSGNIFFFFFLFPSSSLFSVR